mmetsp:Transcript_15742/g.32260  ORF Transcript_15742/g.32260 Transcript_15742/m.32260 type:complete len:82 (+) Transcript_15742:134-379(+)|eukprot:CAMPEP_0183329076 /NCGR_PEP_ID=MMETSP0160_2-20130417/84608_1 /TAXON_ID=2839 ORGANISM="Odontella Sinensis, Strain Grunow 1884" /NCGR_SAMPLE_ID=MMETSP0160_2 /ASSEMBLY_ACC=CAM_ASM_000250 /LENGTH=81 /DNA_ID=CAMNT_0025497255 /DNA_START=469 /DNA_END=714 /DNA_ORIENTATION=-
MRERLHLQGAASTERIAELEGDGELEALAVERGGTIEEAKKKGFQKRRRRQHWEVQLAIFAVVGCGNHGNSGGSDGNLWQT